MMPSHKKNQYIQYLDRFKEININSVIFQVKPMGGDAFYNSPYEPWSKSITGTRGKDPGYDVLAFLIDEAHKRDIEFHAWMNHTGLQHVQAIVRHTLRCMHR